MQQPIFLIVMIALLVGMMWWSSKKNKDAQQKRDDFRASLKPGTQIITIGRVIGTVVEVDEQYDEAVIETEGTTMRFALNAISQEYVRPAYVSDDEVDEEGNPLPAQIEGEANASSDEGATNASDEADETDTNDEADTSDADDVSDTSDANNAK